MNTAVAGHAERNNRETFVSGADVPSSRSGTATGQRLLTQASFAFKNTSLKGVLRYENKATRRLYRY